MTPNCIRAVQQAAAQAGRKALSAAQIAEIDTRLRGKMRQLAGTDPAWQTKSIDQRTGAAAAAAIADLQAEAVRAVELAQLQVGKTAETGARIDALVPEAGARGHAVVRDMDHTGHYITGIKNENVGRLMALLDAVKSGEGANAGRRVMQFLFDADNPQMTRDLANELFRNADGSTGNLAAKEGAKAYLTVIEEMRTRFNGAGGDVGRLEYGYIPQPHDAARVRGDASPAARDKWVAEIMPSLNRSRYVREDGARMSDVELRDVLGSAWETIATEGMNKREPGQFAGGSARANAGSQSRQIHFKDGDSYLAYMEKYGSGSMYDAVIGHVAGMARDIGLVERYGPNPNAQMKLQFDLAERADGKVVRDFGMRPETYWDMLSGKAGTPQSALIARLGTNARNVQTFAKLGGAVISSITDVGTFFVSTGYNKLPYWDAFANVGRGFSKETRDFMTAHGVIAESMMGDLNRWTGDSISQSWSGRLAQSTMKLSLMNAWTDTLRRGFSLTMMQGLARLSKTEWGAMGEWDRALMVRRGITEADWAVMRRADLTEYGGTEHMTPQAIRATGDARANEVVAKVLGLIQDESEFAVINPDLATKALAAGGAIQRGTVRGELARSIMQFKSFPMAMVSRHWRRMLDAPATADGSAPLLANRLVYGGAMLVTTSALGAIALQVKQVIAGKDPIDMQGEHAGKFWAKAVAQGGGLSIVGDLLLNDPADSPGGMAANAVKTALGPSIGSAADLLLKVGAENVWQAATGKTTHAGAETVAWAKSNAPLLGLWYARAAVDHMGLHALQENLSPGYLSKMQDRARKDWNQGYWWKPGTGGPERAPNLPAAVGAK